jgi:hypothetical protein
LGVAVLELLGLGMGLKGLLGTLGREAGFGTAKFLWLLKISFGS